MATRSSILAWRTPVKSLVGSCPLGSQFSLLYTFSTQQSFHFLILSVTGDYKEAMKAKCFKNILKGLRIKVKIYQYKYYSFDGAELFYTKHLEKL